MIDFEFAAYNGDAMNIMGYKFASVMSYGASYCGRHDLVLVGMLITRWAAAAVTDGTLDTNALEFIAMSNSAEITATIALGHKWLH